MSIPREQIDTVDFSDVADTTALLAPMTPGEILHEDFMQPLGLSAMALAHALCISPARITNLLNGQEPLRADLALRLARYFNTTPQSWLNLQQNYELEVARRTLGQVIAQEIIPRAA